MLIIPCFKLTGQEITKNMKQADSLSSTSISWVDSVFESLNPDERIAQLFMVAAWSNKDSNHIREISDLITKYKIGGLMFMQGGPGRQARLTNYYRSLSTVPLMIAIDAEWGLGMRLDSTVSFPRQMMLGAIAGDSLVYEMGKEVARQCRLLGININFAPVADINNNPSNPVINSRSFGENKMNVTEKALAYMRGLQDNGVFACGKHFPGHGDTDTDSHLSLPLLQFPKSRLDTLELYPFKKLIEKGLKCMMVAHLSVPALDSAKNAVTTLSSKVVTGLLKNELGFQGLVFTDALNMKAANTTFKPGELEVKALIAGNDVLLFPENVPVAIKEIQKAISSGKISSIDIDMRCKKILVAKYLMGLNHQSKVDTKNIHARLNTIQSELLKRKMVESSLTLVKNDNNLIPLKRLDTLSIAVISTGNSDSTVFQQFLGFYTQTANFSFDAVSLREQVSFTAIITDDLQKIRFEADSCSISKIIENIPSGTSFIHKVFLSEVISDLFTIHENPDSCSISIIINRLRLYREQFINSFIEEYISKLQAYNLIIIGVTNTDRRPSKNFGIMPESVNLISLLSEQKNIILAAFANPYSIPLFGDISKLRSIIIAYEDQELSQDYAAQLIFGGIPVSGSLPVSASSDFPAGFGVKSPLQTRLKYTIPEETGIDSGKLLKIDSLALNAIYEKATPGCQVLVAYKGNVIFRKSYGFHTYINDRHVINSDIYDLASVTKVAATTISLMKLYEEKRLGLDSRLSEYFPRLKKSDKKKIIIKDVLTHQARFQPWIPFYLSTQSKGKLKNGIYNNRYSEKFSIKVADNLYIRNDYEDTIFREIAKSGLLEKKAYRYSDLGFILMGRIIQNITGQPLDNYSNNYFYKSLGASTLGFRPLERFRPDQIVPTENDTIFRHQLLRGNVHDPAAAMLGGVAGHAGLFSNSDDLAKLMQMLLDYGSYGGEKFIEPSTVKLFTSCQFCNAGNRRGLGFDKPEPDTGKESPVCREASLSSFGHTGFTGTMVWADPEKELVYIFLSNRVYPDQNNNKLLKMNVRTNIQSVIYKALK